MSINLEEERFRLTRRETEMPQGIATQPIEIQTPPSPSEFYLLPVLMDWFDDFVPFSFALQSEELSPIKIEEFASDSEFIIRVELPGVDPDNDIDVIVANGCLTIKGERRQEHRDDQELDFHYGSFIRSLALPIGVDESDVHATYDDGILEVKVELPAPSIEMNRVKVQRIG